MATKDKDQRGAPAANDDLLGEAARNEGAVDTTDGRMTPDANEPVPGRGRANDRGEAKPGEDENQAGFLKDPDQRFSP